MIPLVHDFSGETVLIFGGGTVGARRARALSDGARVTVISPAFADEDFGGADLVREAPAPGDVAAIVERASPALVVAATDDGDLNDAVEAAARDAGALANRADRAGGDVIVPATVRDGRALVAVSTGGTAPALSAELRRRIEGEIEGAGALAAAVAELRRDLRDRDVPAGARREAMRAVVESDRVWAAARWSGAEARQAARNVAAAALEDTDG